MKTKWQICNFSEGKRIVITMLLQGQACLEVLQEADYRDIRYGRETILRTFLETPPPLAIPSLVNAESLNRLKAQNKKTT